MNPIRILRSATDYDAALAEYESYFDREPEPGSEAADRFELLGLVLSRYEETRHPVGEADPAEVIRLTMQSGGYSQSDLAEVLGSRSRASEILNHKRSLTLDQVRALHRRWRIPIGALVGEAAPA